MNGFTYNGVHCESLGLYYIPTRDDQWFSDPEYDVYSDDVDWRHGGYYYASKAKIRTFTIKCYFEEITVAQRQAIKEWLHRDSQGMLIFDEMPFVYWNVRPGKVPAGNWYNDLQESHSGTVTITFNAYEPFGYLTRKSNSGQSDNASDYCNLIDASDMPAAPTTSSRVFNVYNPGTEACGLSIDIKASASNPIRFFNDANGTYCIFGSFPTGGLYVKVDGDTGYISIHLQNSSASGSGFAYHDKGIIRLEPNVGRSGITYVNGQINGTTYQLDLTNYPVSNALRGATLTLANSGVLTVMSVSKANNRVYCTAESAVTLSQTGTCSIMTVNKITIEEKTGSSWVTPTTLTIGDISIDYKPRAL